MTPQEALDLAAAQHASVGITPTLNRSIGSRVIKAQRILDIELNAEQTGWTASPANEAIGEIDGQ